MKDSENVVTPRKPKKGNSLAEARPDVAAEWDHEMNGAMTPSDLSRGSAFVAWWDCKACGTKYKCSVASRTAGGRGCPECGKRRFSEAKRKARLTTEQFAQKIADVNPDIEVVGEFTGYRNNIAVRCRTCGREWSASPYNLIAGRGCASCHHWSKKNK